MANGLDVLLRVIGDASSGVQAMGQSTAGMDKFRLGVVAAGAALAAFSLKVGADAVSAFGGLDAAMRNVQSVTLETDAVINQTTESIKQMANRDLIASPKEYAKALYDVRSAGIDSSIAMETLDKIVKTAKGTLADTADVAKVVTGTMNAYGSEVVDADKITNLFVATIQRGVTSGGELASYFGQLPKLGQTAGVSIEELTSSIAVMTRNFIKTPEAVTGMKAAIQSLLKPNKELEELYSRLNYESGEAFIKQNGLSGAMQILAKETGGSADALGKLFSSTEAMVAVSVLASDGAKEFTEEIKAQTEATDARQKAVDQQTKAYEAQVKALGIAFNILMVDIGKNIVPALLDFVKGISGLIQKFNSLDEDVRDSYVNGALRVLLGGGLITAIYGIATAFKALGISLTTNMIPALISFAPLIAPITLALTGLASVVYGVKMSFDQLQKAVAYDEYITRKAKAYSDAMSTIKALGKQAVTTREDMVKLQQAYKTAYEQEKEGTKLHKLHKLQYEGMTNAIKAYDDNLKNSLQTTKENTTDIKNNTNEVKDNKETRELASKRQKAINAEILKRQKELNAEVLEEENDINDKRTQKNKKFKEERRRLDDAIAEAIKKRQKELNAEVLEEEKKANDLRIKANKNFNKKKKDEEDNEKERAKEWAEEKIRIESNTLRILGTLNNQFLSGASKATLKFKNLQRDIANDNVFGVAKFAVQEFVNSVNHLSSAWSKWDNAMKDSVLTANELHDFTQEYAKGLPVIGEAFAGFLDMIETGLTKLLGKKTQDEIKGWNKGLEDLADSLSDKLKDIAKDRYDSIKDYAKDAYDEQVKLAEDAVKQQEKAVDKLQRKLDDIQNKIRGRKETRQQSLQAASAFEQERLKYEGADFYGMAEEDFTAKMEDEAAYIDYIYAKGSLTFDEMQKKRLELAAKRALYFSKKAKDVDDYKERAEYTRKSAGYFNDYKDAVLELSDEELRRQEAKASKELENAQNELDTRQSNLDVLQNSYDLFIANLEEKFKQPADSFLNSMTGAIQKVNSMISSSQSKLNAMEQRQRYSSLSSNSFEKQTLQESWKYIPIGGGMTLYDAMKGSGQIGNTVNIYNPVVKDKEQVSMIKNDIYNSLTGAY